MGRYKKGTKRDMGICLHNLRAYFSYKNFDMILLMMVSSVYPVFIVLTFKEINLNFLFILNSKTGIRIKNKHMLTAYTKLLAISE